MPQTRQHHTELKIDTKWVESLPLPITSIARNLAEGEYFPFHHHQRAQLVYANKGLMSVTTESSRYVVPPQRAVWMPAQTDHRIDALSDVSMRTLYVDASMLETSPDSVHVLQVTPLLRELVIGAIAIGNDYRLDSPEGRLMHVILDQISRQSKLALGLPQPDDKRLTRITQALMNNPADSRNLDEWAHDIGASKRTINRLFAAETGMSFRQWRQQRRVQRALELLESGSSVTETALETGYDNTSAFIAMFRRALGTTPTQYLRDPR